MVSPAKVAPELLGDVRLPDDFEIVPAFGAVLQPEHPPRGVVHELQPSLLVDDEHAFDHAAEDRFHAGAIGLEIRGPLANLADRVVQGPRDRPDLVVAVVADRQREIAARVALGHSCDGTNATAQDGRCSPGERERGEEAGAEGDERNLPHGCELVAMLVSGSASRTSASSGASALATGTAT